MLSEPLSFHLPTFWLWKGTHIMCLFMWHLLSSPILNHLAIFLINLNTHEYCITTSLEEACTRKLPLQWNEKKCVAQKNKRQCVICECVLYKYFKSKWKKCCCTDLYWYLQVSIGWKHTIGGPFFVHHWMLVFWVAHFWTSMMSLLKNTFTF
jgi:hypothetical protein